MIRFWQRLTRATQQGPDADIRTLMRREFGLRVGQRRTYDEALTHSSMLDGDKTGLKSNERLEFLGDVVLDMTMANYLYRAFPDAQEGEMTKRKSLIVNRKKLILMGKKMGLHHLIQAKMRREDIHDSMVGNALEALIGAIYLDHGFKKTQRAVLLMLKHYGLDEQVNETHDFKSQLHQWATKRKKKLAFEVLKDDDTAGEERYEIAAKVNGEVYGIGIGRSKKLASRKPRAVRGRKSTTAALRGRRRKRTADKPQDLQAKGAVLGVPDPRVAAALPNPSPSRRTPPKRPMAKLPRRRRPRRRQTSVGTLAFTPFGRQQAVGTVQFVQA